MKLDECLELGYIAGLSTISEAYNNVCIHATSLYVYDNINYEVAELYTDIVNNGIDFKEKIRDHISLKRLQEINAEIFEKEIPF